MMFRLRFFIFLLLGMAAIQNVQAMNVTNVFARQRYPWNNLVDIQFEVNGLEWQADEKGDPFYVRIGLKDSATGECYLEKSSQAFDSITNGVNQILWDAGAEQVPIRSTNAVYTIHLYKRDMTRYAVVDLSAGSWETSRYPISYFSEISAENLSYRYKTDQLVLRRIDPGTNQMVRTFQMGSPEGELGRNPENETLHDEKIAQSFYLGVFEITQKQWRLVTGENPSSYVGDTHPVENVSYDMIHGKGDSVDPQSFIGQICKRTENAAFNLPTGAQWEYACRAGTVTALNNGENLTDELVCPKLSKLARYYGNQGSGNHSEVGMYLPNEWGLYDMHGNVSEWSLDTAPTQWGGIARIMRGGSWNDYAKNCRSAALQPFLGSAKNSACGFRLSLQKTKGNFEIGDKEIASASSDSYSRTIVEKDIRAVLFEPTYGFTYSDSWEKKTNQTVVISSQREILFQGTGTGVFHWTTAEEGKSCQFVCRIGDKTNATAKVLVMKDAVKDLDYSFQLEAGSGASGTWKLIQPQAGEDRDGSSSAFSNLPLGITLSSSGELAGKTTDRAGEYLFAAEFTEGGNQVITNVYPLRVREKKNLTLEVQTAYGTANPEKGTHQVPEGESVNPSVQGEHIEESGLTRHLCTGWSGTGGAPEEGSGTNFTFTIWKDSSVVWNWRTEYWLTLEATDHGKLSMESSWNEAGKRVIVRALKSDSFKFIRWEGDLDSTEQGKDSISFLMDRPRSITARFESHKKEFQVNSAYGSPVPTTGSYELPHGSVVTASVNRIEYKTDKQRFVCSGWDGTGSVPESGNHTNVVITLDVDSSITWNWKTNYWLDMAVEGSGTFLNGDVSGWKDPADIVQVQACPAPNYEFEKWAGDLEECILEGAGIDIPMNRARNLTAIFKPINYTLTVYSMCGNPDPANGPHTYQAGSLITAQIPSPISVGTGTNLVCSGWSGSGSVPAQGNQTHVIFKIDKNSSVSWNWKTNFLVEVEVGGAKSVQSFSEWGNQGETNYFEVNPTEAYVNVTLSGDTNGVSYVNPYLSVPGDKPRKLTMQFELLPLGAALDNTNLIWTTGENYPWFSQRSTESSSDHIDFASSGIITNQAKHSFLQTKVQGPGSLTFCLSTEAFPGEKGGLTVYLDGNKLSGYPIREKRDWSSTNIVIETGGSHTIRWDVESDGISSNSLVHLDQVQWKPGTTTKSKIPVPCLWLDQYGLATDGDYEAAATNLASNGMIVWECYEAGLDPTNKNSRFLANFEITDGARYIRWSPDLGKERLYQIEGKTNLTDSVWIDLTTNACDLLGGFRFFRVKVSLPDAK